MENKTQYYVCLRNVTEKNDWESYILYMLDMVEETARNGIERLENVVQLMERTGANIKAQFPKIYSKDLLEILFRLPYTKRKNLIDAEMGTPKTVGKYLSTLERAGYLKSIRAGKEKLYLNYELMKILEKK